MDLKPIKQGKLTQIWSFPDGAPNQFWGPFPNPADSVAGTIYERQMNPHGWNDAYKSQGTIRRRTSQLTRPRSSWD